MKLAIIGWTVAMLGLAASVAMAGHHNKKVAYEVDHTKAVCTSLRVIGNSARICCEAPRSDKTVEQGCVDVPVSKELGALMKTGLVEQWKTANGM